MPPRRGSRAAATVAAETIYAAVLGALARSFPDGLDRVALRAAAAASVEGTPTISARQLDGALQHLVGWWAIEEVDGTFWATSAAARAWQLHDVASPASTPYTLRVDGGPLLVAETFSELAAAIGEQALQRAQHLVPRRARVGLAQEGYDLLLRQLASHAGEIVEVDVLGARWVLTRPRLARAATRAQPAAHLRARAS